MSDPWDWEEDEEEEELYEAPPSEEKTRRYRRRSRGQGESDGRGNWYLLTGLILGVAVGLLFAWVISPVKYVDTGPDLLAPQYKDTYRRVIALAYSATGNLDRARERMKLVDQDNAIPALASQAKRMLDEKQPPEEARALAVLASDLGRNPGQAANRATAIQIASPVAVVGTTSQPVAESTQPSNVTATAESIAAVQTPTLPLPTATPTMTVTPQPTFTPRPTATPIRVLDAPFALKDKQEICDGSAPANLLQVEVSGADGKPLPGVRILITWQEGEDSFYTGLAPEISPGYADFWMVTGIPYSLKVGDASQPLNGLKVSGSCGWRLEFSQEEGG